jgi:hypothetical protein
MDIYEQIKSGYSNPFVDSVYWNSQADLLNILTSQGSPPASGQSTGVRTAGEINDECTELSNPSMDPAVEAHERAHIEFCRDHGTLKEAKEREARGGWSGEGDVYDYIRQSEIYAYDAEIAYRMSELSSSGCL